MSAQDDLQAAESEAGGELRFVADPRADPAMGMLYDPDDAEGRWIRAERRLFVDIGCESLADET